MEADVIVSLIFIMLCAFIRSFVHSLIQLAVCSLPFVVPIHNLCYGRATKAQLHSAFFYAAANNTTNISAIPIL